jgi:hypothetical protein
MSALSEASTTSTDDKFFFTTQSAIEFLETVLTPALSAQSSIDLAANSGPTPSNKRQTLLTLQKDILQSHATTTSTSSSPPPEADVINAFIALGKTDDQTLKDAVKKMNEALRQTYILALTQGKPEKSTLKSDGAMFRSEVIEFLDACIGMVHLQTTKDRLASEWKESGKIPNPTLFELQADMLECVGVDREFGVTEVGAIRVRYGGDGKGYGGDAEVLLKLESFEREMRGAISLACQGGGWSQASSGDAKDGKMQDDGTTRVMSVKHSADIEGIPKKQQAMNDETAEAARKTEFEMARRAATLQQDILAELLSFDDEERTEVMEECKDAHDTLMKNVVSLTTPTQRAEFMQTIGHDVQRKLVMYKMWEAMVQKNGGKEPVINRDQALDEDGERSGRE